MSRLNPISFWRKMLVAFAFMPGLLVAQQVHENALKTAFVYNFVMFTEWPQEAFKGSNSINICVNAINDMQQAMLTLDGKSAGGRHIKVRQLRNFDIKQTQCHVLYLDSIDRKKWPTLKKLVARTAILTISDEDGIGQDGAMIALSLQDNKIVFDINQTVARESQLTFSSKLLRLARTVK